VNVKKIQRIFSQPSRAVIDVAKTCLIAKAPPNTSDASVTLHHSKQKTGEEVDSSLVSGTHEQKDTDTLDYISSKSVFVGEQTYGPIELPQEIIDYFSIGDGSFQTDLDRVLYETNFPQELILDKGIILDGEEGIYYFLALPYEAASMTLSKLRPETLLLLSKTTKIDLNPDEAHSLMQQTLDYFLHLRSRQTLGSHDSVYMTFEFQSTREAEIKEEKKKQLLRETGAFPDFVSKQAEEFEFTLIIGAAEAKNPNELSREDVESLELEYGGTIFLQNSSGNLIFDTENLQIGDIVREVKDYLLLRTDNQDSNQLKDFRKSFSGLMTQYQKEKIIEDFGEDVSMDLGVGCFRFNPSNKKIQENRQKYDRFLAGLLVHILQARVDKELKQGSFAKTLAESRKLHDSRNGYDKYLYLAASLLLGGGVAYNSLAPSSQEAPSPNLNPNLTSVSIDTPEPTATVSAAEPDSLTSTPTSPPEATGVKPSLSNLPKQVYTLGELINFDLSDNPNHAMLQVIVHKAQEANPSMSQTTDVIILDLNEIPNWVLDYQIEVKLNTAEQLRISDQLRNVILGNYKAAASSVVPRRINEIYRQSDMEQLSKEQLANVFKSLFDNRIISYEDDGEVGTTLSVNQEIIQEPLLVDFENKPVLIVDINTVQE
jgi:hypothetical protein